MWKEKSMNLRGGNKFDSRYEPGVPHRAHSSWAQLKENKRVSCVIKRENCYSDAKASLAHTERWKAQINICFNHKGTSFLRDVCHLKIHRAMSNNKQRPRPEEIKSEKRNFLHDAQINKKYNMKEAILYSIVYIGGQCTRKTLQQ